MDMVALGITNTVLVDSTPELEFTFVKVEVFFEFEMSVDP
jgi:hypothetical protein